jgi:phage shock protein C
MICSACQKVIIDGSTYCYNCGAKQMAAGSGTAQTPRAAAQAPRKLTRSSTDKKLGGVCAGLGNYFDVDITLVRVLWLVGSLCSAGSGLLVYLILWIVLPVEPLYVPVATQTSVTQ